MVDIKKLQQQCLLNQLQSSDLPLASRPLLVPVSYPLCHQLKAKIEDIKRELVSLGIQIEETKDEKLVLRSVPVQVPYLDIRLFWDALAALEHYSVDVLLDLLAASQAFDAKLLSAEERMQLDKLILSGQVPEFLCAPLTEDRCRMILHV
jgi:DNA mismatch repair protein MutL